MTDKEGPTSDGDHDPADPISPGFVSPGGITGGSAPPPEPIPTTDDPFSSSGRDSGPRDSRAWLWALAGLVLFAIVALVVWLVARGDDGGAGYGAPAAVETVRSAAVAGIGIV
jgi:MYXO-CTERM domain-containing protein